MNITSLDIPDIKIIAPDICHDDHGGFYFQSFCETQFAQAMGIKVNFVQDNHSKSHKNVCRGLHYQRPPYAQAKLVRVVKGTICDVVLDIRPSSQRFGQSVSVILSAQNHHQIWIPEGFAHGFIALDDDVEILYKTNQYYSKDHEGSVFFDTQYMPSGDINITALLRSEKDLLAPQFDDIDFSNINVIAS